MPAPIIVSYSELDTYRQCPLKHYLGYKNRWRKPVEGGTALSKGSLWHLVMEDHHRVLMESWDDGTLGLGVSLDGQQVTLDRARELARTNLLDDRGDYVSDDAELIDWMYQGYVEQYGADLDWRPVAVEYPFQIPLPTPEGRDSHYHLKGKIDVVLRHVPTGLLWIEDHKSCSNLPSNTDMEIDDQFGLYTWAIQRLGHQVVGSIHSAARTKRNTADYPGYSGKLKPQVLDDRFRRTLLNRSDAEVNAVAADAYAAARNAYPPKSKELPLYSAPDPRQCGWKCDFKEVHMLMRQGSSDVEALESYGFHQDFTRHN